jgi:hypothetical protein
MKHQIYTAVAVAVFGLVLVQQRSEYRDRNGQFIGHAERWNNTTQYYDRDGRYEGKSVRDGTRTEFYGKDGRYLGSERREERK